MTNWTEGYVAELDYTYGYYLELSPQRINFALLHAGFMPPEVMNACELGFGQGISINIHAASSDIEWFGTDFSPNQVSFAQEVANASGAKIRLTDDTFQEFAVRDDLPDFDYIQLHGIWSWISDENRAVITDFIRRKLKVGGVVYFGYNTLPGWSTFAPIRHLLTEYANKFAGHNNNVESRVRNSLEFANKLFETNPRYLEINSIATKKFEHIKLQDHNYLAHEYFNRDWYPMYFSEMAEILKEAKLTYACSAHYLDHVDALNLNNQQQEYLNQISDFEFKQTVRDFMVSQQFRRDYWVKGARKLNYFERLEKLRKERFILTKYRSDVLMTVDGALGECSLSEEIYSPILDLMADHKIKSVMELEVVLKNTEITFSMLIEALMVLAGAGIVAPVQSTDSIEKSRKSTRKVNDYFIQKAIISNELKFLASPVIGCGIGVSRFEQLFVLAIQKNLKTPTQWAAFVEEKLHQQGQKIVANGNILETRKQNLDELILQANEFELKRVSILRELQIL